MAPRRAFCRTRSSGFSPAARGANLRAMRCHCDQQAVDIGARCGHVELTAPARHCLSVRRSRIIDEAASQLPLSDAQSGVAVPARARARSIFRDRPFQIRCSAIHSVQPVERSCHSNQKSRQSRPRPAKLEGRTDTNITDNMRSGRDQRPRGRFNGNRPFNRNRETHNTIRPSTATDPTSKSVAALTRYSSATCLARERQRMTIELPREFLPTRGALFSHR